MNDNRTPTGPQQGTDTTPDRMPTVTVGEAAHALNVTPDAIRARLKRGTLEGEKVEGTWRVTLPVDAIRRDTGDSDDRQDATGQTTGSQDATGHRQDGDRQDATVDLQPLADLIEDLTRRNADLSAAAAMWQTRAAHLEDRLKQLTVGGDDNHEAVKSHERAPEDAQGANSERAQDRPVVGILATLRRWLSGHQDY